MAGRFIDVFVAAHDEVPDGCTVRFRAVGEPRPVRLIRYSPLVGPPGLFEVEARAGIGDPGPAQAIGVEDPGAGTSTLIRGGDLGLRLSRSTTDGGHPPRPGSEQPIAVPYLLLGNDQIVS